MEKVLQADVLAQNTSEAIGNITKEAKLLKVNATALNQEVDDMVVRTEEAADKLNKLTQLTKTNDSLINAAKEAVSIYFFYYIFLFT